MKQGLTEIVLVVDRKGYGLVSQRLSRTDSK